MLISFFDHVFMKVYEYKPLNKLFSNIWYSLVGILDKNNEIITMNYGYDDDDIVLLDKYDKNNKYALQLYHHIICNIDTKDKDILEVGCGRGGGASYIARCLGPKHVTGIDITKRSIKFDKNKYKDIENLRFKVGDAHNIPFADNTFDIIINVETSHHYKNFTKFLSETKRVLRPKGYLLITDYRISQNVSQFKSDITKSSMNIIDEQDITENVIRALDKDSERKQKIIQNLVPKIFHKLAEDFSGTKNSDLYNSFKNHEWTYLFYILQK